MCALWRRLVCRKVTTSWNWWIFSACLLVVEQPSGKVLERHFPVKVKVFFVFIQPLRDEYFTLHSASDRQNYDLFITQWSRCCGWEVSVSLLFLIDMYPQTVRSLLLQPSMRLSGHCHRYVSASPTLTESYASFSESSHHADFDWCYGRYVSGWKPVTSNAVRHPIWSWSIPHCSAVLTESKPATQDYMHAVRAWSQITHIFQPFHSVSQHEQSPCCNKTKFLSHNLVKEKKI